MIFTILMSAFVIVLTIKTLVATYQRDRIRAAISKYRRKGGVLVTYKSMESYDRTLFRLWDWGYKRILPPDLYKYIERYIEK